MGCSEPRGGARGECLFPFSFSSTACRRQRTMFSGKEHAYLKGTGTIRFHCCLKRGTCQKAREDACFLSQFDMARVRHIDLCLVSGPWDQKLRLEPHPCLCPSNILAEELIESDLLTSNEGHYVDSESTLKSEQSVPLSMEGEGDNFGKTDSGVSTSNISIQ